jgi:ribulose-5-phosphate 4-epimerase/fuculose-1-phosphate aldolase
MNNGNKETEGVIKFHLQFEKTDIILDAQIEILNYWREKLFALKLIGQDPKRYGGLGYGNLSHRVKIGSNEFIITGSQTSHLPQLSTLHYSLVVESNIKQNRLVARGLTNPSSEALTHSAFYQAKADINYVFHVHSPEIWNNAQSLDIPVTSPSITYGTPEMATAIKKFLDTATIDSDNIVAMGGHTDGIIAFGHTANQAGNCLISMLKQVKP